MMGFPAVYFILALYFHIFPVNISFQLMKSRKQNSNIFMSTLSTISSAYKISDLKDMSSKDAIREVCGPRLDEKYTYRGVDIVKKSPTICQYLIANPKAFYENPNIAKQYGVNFDDEDYSGSKPLQKLANVLPVIYIADIHQEYGTLGLMLQNPTMTMLDIRPELRKFRDRPVYLGGPKGKGSSFTMVHKKSGFPENRAWRVIPGDNDFRLYFSPDVAMANELCMTGDAKPNEFKFFSWSTIWLPRALESEYSRKLWLTVSGPSQIIFDDPLPNIPLWRSIVSSLPPSRIGGEDSSSSSSSSENEKVLNGFAMQRVDDSDDDLIEEIDDDDTS